MSESKPESQAVTRLIGAEEREASVKLLTAAFANDAIAVDEFERRVAEVYRVLDAKALQAITQDLPAAPQGAAVPATTNQSTSVAHRPAQKFKSVLSSIDRRIDGPMPERLELRSFIGSMELDLRRADFPQGVTEIDVRVVFGNVEIELPEHVRVEDDGRALLGSFSVRGRSRSRDGETMPVVRITGRSVFANVEVEQDD